MGLFDRFKSNDKKEAKKVVHDEIEIDEEQLLLKKIATTDKDRYKRAEAADKITNQFVALDMSKNVKDRAIRLIAINKVKDEKQGKYKNFVIFKCKRMSKSSNIVTKE